MQSDRMNARPQSKAQLQRSIGITAPVCLALVTFIPAPVAAADREVLYGKAEDLIRYTDDVKGAQRADRTRRRREEAQQEFTRSDLALQRRYRRQDCDDGCGAQGGRRSQREG